MAGYKPGSLSWCVVLLVYAPNTVDGMNVSRGVGSCML